MIDEAQGTPQIGASERRLIFCDKKILGLNMTYSEQSTQGFSIKKEEIGHNWKMNRNERKALIRLIFNTKITIFDFLYNLRMDKSKKKSKKVGKKQNVPKFDMNIDLDQEQPDLPSAPLVLDVDELIITKNSHTKIERPQIEEQIKDNGTIAKIEEKTESSIQPTTLQLQQKLPEQPKLQILIKKEAHQAALNEQLNDLSKQRANEITIMEEDIISSHTTSLPLEPIPQQAHNQFNLDQQTSLAASKKVKTTKKKKGTKKSNLAIDDFIVGIDQQEMIQTDQPSQTKQQQVPRYSQQQPITAENTLKTQETSVQQETHDILLQQRLEQQVVRKQIDIIQPVQVAQQPKKLVEQQKQPEQYQILQKEQKEQKVDDFEVRPLLIAKTQHKKTKKNTKAAKKTSKSVLQLGSFEFQVSETIQQSNNPTEDSTFEYKQKNEREELIKVQASEVIPIQQTQSIPALHIPTQSQQQSSQIVIQNHPQEILQSITVEKPLQNINQNDNIQAKMEENHNPAPASQPFPSQNDQLSISININLKANHPEKAEVSKKKSKKKEKTASQKQNIFESALVFDVQESIGKQAGNPIAEPASSSPVQELSVQAEKQKSNDEQQKANASQSGQLQMQQHQQLSPLQSQQPIRQSNLQTFSTEGITPISHNQIPPMQAIAIEQANNDAQLSSPPAPLNQQQQEFTLLEIQEKPTLSTVKKITKKGKQKAKPKVEVSANDKIVDVFNQEIDQVIQDTQKVQKNMQAQTQQNVQAPTQQQIQALTQQNMQAPVDLFDSSSKPICEMQAEENYAIGSQIKDIQEVKPESAQKTGLPQTIIIEQVSNQNQNKKEADGISKNEETITHSQPTVKNTSILDGQREETMELSLEIESFTSKQKNAEKAKKTGKKVKPKPKPEKAFNILAEEAIVPERTLQTIAEQLQPSLIQTPNLPQESKIIEKAIQNQQPCQGQKSASDAPQKVSANAVPSNNKIVGQLINLIRFHNDEQIRIMRDRMQMLEQDIISRKLRTREIQKRDAKKTDYEWIVQENVALRSEYRALHRP